MSELFEQTSKREPNSPRSEIIPKTVEVGCIPRGDTLPSVLLSVPVYYKEWQNGNFLRHAEGASSPKDAKRQ